MAIGSVATPQQAAADNNTQSPPLTSEVAIGSVATPQQFATDANADEPSSEKNKGDEASTTTDKKPGRTEHQVTIDTTVDWGAYKDPNDTINNGDIDMQQKTSDTDETTYGPVTYARPDLDPTETDLCISNISRDTTKQDLIQLLGLNTTSYLRESVRLKLFFNSQGKYKSYALVTAPKFVR